MSNVPDEVCTRSHLTPRQAELLLTLIYLYQRYHRLYASAEKGINKFPDPQEMWVEVVEGQARGFKKGVAQALVDAGLAEWSDGKKMIRLLEINGS